MRRIFQAQPTSEELRSKMEKVIVQEAKSEEKELKHLVNEVAAKEKDVLKAQKASDKGEDKLRDAEKREHDTLIHFHKAEQKHDEAVSHVHMRENDLQVEMKRRDFDKAQKNLEAKKAQLEAAVVANDRNAAERNVKLAALQAPAGNPVASKVEDATGREPGPSGSTTA